MTSNNGLGSCSPNGIPTTTENQKSLKNPIYHRTVTLEFNSWRKERRRFNLGFGSDLQLLLQKSIGLATRKKRFRTLILLDTSISVWCRSNNFTCSTYTSDTRPRFACISDTVSQFTRHIPPPTCAKFGEHFETAQCMHLLVVQNILFGSIECVVYYNGKAFENRLNNADRFPFSFSFSLLFCWLASDFQSEQPEPDFFMSWKRNMTRVMTWIINRKRWIYVRLQ